MQFFAVFSLIVFIKALFEVKNKTNPYGETLYLSWMGIFVWGDAVVLGPFWLLATWASYQLEDWVLFLLIISVFWLVRSTGEVVYWMNQQFSTIIRNPSQRLKGHRLFKNDSIWFIYQLLWQTVAVISAISTIHLANMWINLP